MKYLVECDMGSIKIFNEGMSCFFANDFGDGTNEVHVVSEKEAGKLKSKLDGVGKFLGHFTVKKGRAHLAMSDCNDIPVCSFSRGRWFVDLVKECVFVIYKIDNDIHA